MGVKIGIVGTGWVAGLHLAALKKIEGVEVAAIAGRNEERGRELTAGTGARVYGEWREMLEKETLDGVMMLLPPHLHGELEEACAGRVKGVLIEKPICLDMGMARRIEGAFARAGTIVSVGYMSRYRRSVELAKEALRGEEVVLVNGRWVCGMPPPMWWRQKAESGGQFVEQCTHLVDLARHLVGEIVEVSAFATKGFVTGVPAYDVNDAMVVNVRFASGAVGNYTLGCHAGGVEEIGLRLSGPRVQVGLSAWEMHLEVQRAKEVVRRHTSAEDIFEVQNRVFVEALASGDADGIRSSYADAVKTLRVTLAAMESLRTGVSVRV